MAAPFFTFPLPGTPTCPGYQIFFYEAGLDVPLDVWTDVDRSVAWSQPIVLNAAGNPDGLIYLSDTPAFKVVYLRDDDVPVDGYPQDNISPYEVAT